jgi:plasmid stabilization system protein ParE
VKRRIRISPRAWSQIDRASVWWRRNRDKAPDAFDTDLDEAFEVIRTNPHVGINVRGRREGVRALSGAPAS